MVMSDEEVVVPEEEPVVKKETIPAADQVFGAARVEQWLTKGWMRRTNAFDSVRLDYVDLSDRHFSFTVRLLQQAVKPGGLIFVPVSRKKDFYLDKFERDKERSTSKYLALIVP
jgi:hypothetical protein